MAEDAIEPGVEANGYVKVLFVPTIAVPSAPTVAELTAETAVAITYALTTTGYTHTTTEEALTTGRFTLANALQKSGKVTDEISITYVYKNDLSDTISTKLPKGATGFLVERWALENGEEWAADQVVNVIPIEAGQPLPDIPAENDPELTRTQRINVVGKVQRDVKVVAGA